MGRYIKFSTAFLYKTKEVARIMEENKDIKEAKEELERISQDDILRRKALNRTLEIADKLQLRGKRSKRKRLSRWTSNWDRKRKKGCNKKVT